ncbi:DNA cytosine methyltransferase [Kitasatospora aureofaciens]|uniref:Cytosine-specific methyltransferase n=1 Tax=Kitasatospora aureofaciens TaxID=1894 RepID=A0A1E7NAS5_KITAU|nr:DNA cytosine methyltransferase [Kitasatospora aureofaciens]ARF78071.1 DNA (cytosine-5-)-methyltransferase [Kitasatospora aureofaciens]OEV37795.1 DNA (cytosine-5-)-methyltransferase [Kitasatospora aureofaciens]GGV07605.1 cytosine-specific methyltransferase [Kitasatospora aureofaciens]
MPGFHSSSRDQIRILDLFSGGGGFAAGFRSFSRGNPGAAEFIPVAAVEFDRAAASTYAANFSSAHVHVGDIEGFDAWPLSGAVDVVVGGPPCQGFSQLGSGHAGDPRNRLWEDYLRFVTTIKPKVFVLENVDRFIKSDEFEEFLAATERGQPLGEYSLAFGVLNSADYGVPQSRRRTIVIGTHKDLTLVDLPRPSHTKSRRLLGKRADPALFSTSTGAGLKPWETVESVFHRSSRKKIQGTELPSRQAEVLPGIVVPGAYRTADLHVGRNPKPLSLARYAAIPPGGNRYDLRGKTALIDGRELALSTASWDNHNSGSADVMGRLRIDRPSVTIRTEFFKPEKGRYLHPFENRPITHYEAALIQGFPEDYQWYGTKLEIARQIGNAVPVGLGSAIAESIHNHLQLR